MAKVIKAVLCYHASSGACGPQFVVHAAGCHDIQRTEIGRRRSHVQVDLEGASRAEIMTAALEDINEDFEDGGGYAPEHVHMAPCVKC